MKLVAVRIDFCEFTGNQIEKTGQVISKAPKGGDPS